MKITTRLTLLLVGSVGVVYILLQLYSFNYYSQLVHQQVDTEAELITNTVIGRIRDVTEGTENTIRTATVGIEMLNWENPDDIYEYLEQVMKKNVEAGGLISGSTLAFNPEIKKQAYFVWVENGKLKKIDITKIYDDVKRPWWEESFNTKKPTWSRPYFDKNAAGKLMVTYSCPILKDGKVVALLTADVYLNTLQKFLAEVSKDNNNEYIFVLYNKDATYVSHPDTQRLAKSALELNKKYPHVMKVIFHMLEGKKDSEMGTRAGQDIIVNYTSIPELGWSVGVVFDEEKIAKSTYDMAYRNIIIILVGLLFILTVIALMARTITKPLLRLTDYVRHVGKNNLSGKVPYTEGKDEIAELAQSFSFMQDELKKYIASERQIAGENARIESEIRFAKDIQESFLPDDETLSKDERFDLGAYLSTAREVGGDLYDFFYLDKDNLLIVLGDVADKGVPASLYMAITMAFARSLAKMFSSPAQIVTHMNENLVRYSKNNMFVTVMMVAINLKTGEARILDAGHGMLYHISDGKPVRPKMAKNIALGVRKGIRFKETKLQLKKGDALFFYTDGVTDALNRKKQPFGEEGVQEMLGSLKKNSSVHQDMHDLITTLQTYIKGAKRVDDIATVFFKKTS